MQGTFELSGDKALFCTIEDNGIGRKDSKNENSIKQNGSLALNFIEQRLELLSKIHKSTYFLKITDKENDLGESLGTKVEIKILILKNRAYDYLLKPIEFEELRNCIQSLSNTTAFRSDPTVNKSKALLEIPVANGAVHVKQATIIKLEADGSYCNIYTKDGNKSTVCRNLKHFESLIDDTIFYRCHKSYVINLNEVLKLISEDGYHAVMSDKSLVEISRNNKSELVSRLKTL